MTSNKFLIYLKNYFLVFLGTLALAFGSVIFLTECEIVAGGVSGVAIIVQHFVHGFVVYDIVVAALMVIFWLLGLIFLGKSFAIRTLFSTVVYIGLTFLFKRVGFFTDLALQFAGTKEVGNYILCGIFGGVFVGAGVAITFLGGGSTGGVDVLQLIASKYWHLRESVTSFMVDAIVIVTGMISMSIGNPEMLIPGLCGILSSFITAVLIETVYNRSLTSYQVDIISDKWEEISFYAQNELLRGATIIRSEGGYKGEERVILRIVFPRNQYEKLREFIAATDPKAFVTFTQTNAVYGEGFTKNKKKPKIKKK